MGGRVGGGQGGCEHNVGVGGGCEHNVGGWG